MGLLVADDDPVILMGLMILYRLIFFGSVVALDSLVYIVSILIPSFPELSGSLVLVFLDSANSLISFSFRVCTC